jgi:hypothetical protein
MINSTDTLRKAELDTLVTLLRDQHARKLDIVVPTAKVWSRNGEVYVVGSEPVLSADGVTKADGMYSATRVFDEGLAEKVGMPLPYLRKMRENGWTDLIDGNVNGLLHGFTAGDGSKVRASDTRSFMLRLFRGEGGTGVARAMLSDRYRVVDNLDVLTAALSGMRQAGLNADVIDTCDLTDRRMYVRVVAPQIKVYAPELLKGYRSPFTGASGADNPTVFAGFVLSNSETGGGAATLTPRIVFQVCQNGMTITKDVSRSIHLGGKLESGVVDYSSDTQEKNLALITAKTRDAVKTFLDPAYVRRVLEGIAEAAGQPVDKPVDHIRLVAKKLSFSATETDTLLDHFVRGGDMTKGGVMNAVTSTAQTLEDADKAAAMEAQALNALAV